HVALLGPALAGLPSLGAVVEEGVEAATGHDDTKALVKDGGVDGIVTAEGMADRPEAAALHAGELLEQVEGAAVVPDGLHGATFIAERPQVGIVGDVQAGATAEAQRGIGRGNGHESALRQGLAILEV